MSKKANLAGALAEISGSTRRKPEPEASQRHRRPDRSQAGKAPAPLPCTSPNRSATSSKSWPSSWKPPCTTWLPRHSMICLPSTASRKSVRLKKRKLQRISQDPMILPSCRVPGLTKGYLDRAFQGGHDGSERGILMSKKTTHGEARGRDIQDRKERNTCQVPARTAFPVPDLSSARR